MPCNFCIRSPDDHREVTFRVPSIIIHLSNSISLQFNHIRSTSVFIDWYNGTTVDTMALWLVSPFLYIPYIDYIVLINPPVSDCDPLARCGGLEHFGRHASHADEKVTCCESVTFQVSKFQFHLTIMCLLLVFEISFQSSMNVNAIHRDSSKSTLNIL